MQYASIMTIHAFCLTVIRDHMTRGCVLVFVPSMGLFFISDLLGGGKEVLMGNLIQNQILTARNWPFGAALSVVMMLMTLLFLFVYRKSTKQSQPEGMA